jgi:hypothetical protein
MLILIFLVGALLGMMTGGVVSVRYLRREISATSAWVAADIEPKLKRILVQLDIIQSALDLAVVTRHEELSTRPLRVGPSHHLP